MIVCVYKNTSKTTLFIAYPNNECKRCFSTERLSHGAITGEDDLFRYEVGSESATLQLLHPLLIGINCNIVADGCVCVCVCVCV